MDPLDFRLKANLYQKLPFLTILGAVSPHFYSHSGKNWHDGGDLGLPLNAKFCKNRFRGYPTPLEQIFTKNSIFLPFWQTLVHISKTTVVKFGARGRSGTLSSTPIFLNHSLRGTFLPKIRNLRDFELLTPTCLYLYRRNFA